MFETVIDWFREVFGFGTEDPGYLAMALRALLVYVVILFIVRIGSRRFLAKFTAFDVVVGIMIGSIGSRAITGNSPFGPAIASIAALVFLHWLFGRIAFLTDDFGYLLKGHPRQLIKDGELRSSAMAHSNITKRDIETEMRRKGLTRIDDIREAWLERDGSISVIRK